MIAMIAICLALVAIGLTFSRARSAQQRRQIAIAMAGVVALSGGSELWMRSTDWRLTHLPGVSTASERNALASQRHATRAVEASSEAISKYVTANRDKLMQDQK